MARTHVKSVRVVMHICNPSIYKARWEEEKDLQGLMGQLAWYMQSETRDLIGGERQRLIPKVVL